MRHMQDQMEETIQRIQEQITTLENEHKEDTRKMTEFGLMLLGEVRNINRKVGPLLR